MKTKTMTQEALKSKAAAVGITEGVFTDLWAKYGPLVMTFLVQFLQQVMVTKSKSGMKAGSIQCDPDCLAKLDAAIEQLTTGLAGTICHRECMACDEE